MRPATQATPDRVLTAPRTALVVDEQALVRKALKDLLHSIGFETVQTAQDPLRAIQMMESETFGLVLCEVRFRSRMTGCEVLEYARARRLIAPSATFVLLAAAADRSLVATSREWQPDALLLKPVVPALMAPRIEQALSRRAAFAPVHEASQRGDPARVLDCVDELIQQSNGPTLEMLRWKTQSLLDLGRFELVRESCNQALGIKPSLPWAELALARCDHEDGRSEQACEQLGRMLRLNPYLGGAYDLLVEIHQQAGRTAQALEVAQAAASSLATARRLRTVGEMAYAKGDLALAESCYVDLIQTTGGSLTRSGLDVGMLGQVLVTRGQAEKAIQLVARSSARMADDPDSQALAASVIAQAHTARGDGEAAQDFARKALTLAASSSPPQAVAMLVAQGAFAAGLKDEATALVRETISDAPVTAVGALARKVLADAGLRPESFVRAAPVVSPGVPARPAKTEAESRPAPEEGDRERPVSADLDAALDALHQARFDEALGHVEQARRRLPANPLVLMTAVQVYMMAMHARGFDPDTAREVRRCLGEVDRQIPGSQRVFASRTSSGSLN